MVVMNRWITAHPLLAAVGTAAVAAVLTLLISALFYPEGVAFGVRELWLAPLSAIISYLFAFRPMSSAAAVSVPAGRIPGMEPDDGRPMPPLVADERGTLEGWLDFYRATLARKCAGLSEEQLRTAAAPPSELTLLGLVRHMAEVERNWFRRVLLGEQVPPIHPEDGEQNGHSGGFALTATTFEQARSTWEAEIAQARTNAATRELDATSPFLGGEVTLRWIYTHMIGEYARHDGHADLLRERLDGTTGV